MNLRHLIALNLLFIKCCALASVVITGDSAAPSNQSFSFLMNNFTQTSGADPLFIGAAASAAGSSLDYAIARLTRGSNSFTPLTPETVKIEDGEGQPNPLYNKGIAFLDVMEGKDLVSGNSYQLVACAADNLKQLILFFQDYKPITLMISTPALDTTGAPTNAIRAVGSGLSRSLALVEPTAGGFGDTGTGVSQIVFGTVDKVYRYAPLDAVSGVATAPALALPLDRTSAQLKINSDLATLAVSSSHIHFHSWLSRFFIPVSATSAAGALDGARSIAVARVNDNGSLSLSAIAPDAAFSAAGDHTVGVVGASETITALHVNSMLTTTGLPYLIVVGGDPAQADVTTRVSALPLVSGDVTPELIGTIASKDAVPEDVYEGGSKERYLGRHFKTPATTPAELPDGADDAVMVGGGLFAGGPIAGTFVSDDAVFIVVQNPVAGYQPGIFFSRAIFSADGRIARWTTWARAQTFFDQTTGAIDAASHMLFDKATENTTIIIPVGGATTIVKQSRWGTGDTQGSQTLIEHVGAALPINIAGVQSVSQLPRSINGLQDDISVIIFGGLGKIVVAQTGQLSASDFVPVNGAAYEPFIAFKDGAITQTFPTASTYVFSVEGGVLTDMGPILTATAADDGAGNGYLIVGGTHGVAILSHPDGSGWDTATELADQFLGLTDDMTFKKFGNYQFVRKIIADGPYVYVLSDTTLDRIDLTLGNPGLGDINRVSVATPSQTRGFSNLATFTDFIVNGDFALLGTSQGVWRVGNGVDIRTVTTPTDAFWQRVVLGEGVAAIQQFLFSTPSSTLQSLAQGGGNVFVMDAYRGKQQTRMHRLTIAPFDGSGITDTTVQNFPDLFVKNIPSFFLNFGTFRDWTAFYGETVLSAVSKEKGIPNNLYALRTSIGNPPAQSGQILIGVHSIPVVVPNIEGSLVSALVRTIASGSYLFTGDFGVRSNE